MQKPYKYTGVERRKFVRSPLSHPVLLAPAESEDFKTSICMNISLDGMLLFSPDFHEPGNEVKVRISTSVENTEDLNLVSKVIWSDEGVNEEDPEERRYLIAVQFQNLSTNQRGTLQRFIAANTQPIES